MIGVILSANREWRAAKSILNPQYTIQTPYGESFESEHIRFVQGGWGKVDAAASCQYLISNWKPKLVLNFGTCGGIGGRVDKGSILLVEKTVIYDIYEKMFDPDEAIRAYMTELDLTWLSSTLPLKDIERGVLLSADRDLDVADIPVLIEKYGAKAVDWESASIARVCKKNKIPVVILRGVTDLVWPDRAHEYENNKGDFERNTHLVIGTLLETLGHWKNLTICHSGDTATL